MEIIVIIIGMLLINVVLNKTIDKNAKSLEKKVCKIHKWEMLVVGNKSSLVCKECGLVPNIVSFDD